MERTYKTYYSVTYSTWGRSGTQEAWFDDKARADKFANHDYRDKPIAHRVSNPSTVKRYDELVSNTDFSLNSDI